MIEPSAPLLFPYMRFARTEGLAGAFALTQSGMPPPDAKLLASDEPLDLSFAGSDALPRFQERLAASFGVAKERVLVTLGASGAMHVLAVHFFRPGARVVSEIPSYDPLRALPGLFGAELRLLPRRFDERWAVDPARVRAELTGAKGPGHVFVTTPHNPSGAVIPEATLRALALEAERAGGILISNEIYMEYATAEQRLHAFRLAPNAVSIGSLTKAYGLGALRAGWIVLGEGLVAQRDAIEDKSFLDCVDPPTPAVRLALKGLELLPVLRDRIAALERESKPHFARWLESSECVEGLLPDIGLIAFPRLRRIQDTRALARHLVREHDVGVVPGEFFGAPGHIRVGFGLPEARLREALERLERGIRAFENR